MIGSQVSHYRILEQIGSGGMGVVFKAQDLKLLRNVALKFLNERMGSDRRWLSSLRHEAMAASSLNHPNICIIHDIDEHDGRPFIVMEFLDGFTLQKRVSAKPLSIAEVVEIGIQLADALDAAHQMNVLHRDIKPANIFLLKGLRAKLLDFGLSVAVPCDIASPNSASNATTAASESRTAGTPAYMSPEQAAGSVVDTRSDVFSLGVVISEMLSGLSPFLRSGVAATMKAVMHDPVTWPPSVISDVPQKLLDVAEKTLEKDPELRYQSARELLTDLRRFQKYLRAGGTAQVNPRASDKLSEAGALVKSSIAVLPFEDLSAERDQAFFCDGMAEELINTLTRLDGLQVMGRTSAFALRSSELDARQIGGRLRVETILEGSVRKSGNRIRVTANLINVADGYTLWADSYDRHINDVFEVQEELSRSIVKALAVKLIEGDDRLLSRGTDHIEAYHLYLRGRYEWNKRTAEALHESIRYYELALAEAPEYATAYAGLADAYFTLGEYGIRSPHEVMTTAKQAAVRAIELQDRHGGAHASLGLILAGYDYEWKSAEHEFLTSLRFNPGSAGVHHWYGMFLAWMGRFDEALAEILRAQTLDPLSPPVNWARGAVLTYARRPNDAIREYRQMAAAVPGFFGWYLGMGDAYMQLGQHAEAVRAFRQARALSDRNVLITGMLGFSLGRLGKTDEALELEGELNELAREQYVSPIGFYLIAHGMNDTGRALDLLDRSYEERSSLLVRIKVDHKVDDLRDNPRFIDLLQRMHLDD